MSHWANIDENNIVISVTVGDNNDPNGDEGYQWLIDNLGGTWIKASYNTFRGVHLLDGTPLRKNYPGVGYSYDEILDAFIPPKPFPSWVLNEDKGDWEAPIPYPGEVVDKIKTTNVEFLWDESTTSWVHQSEIDLSKLTETI
jgi:hypothetical protein